MSGFRMGAGGLERPRHDSGRGEELESRLITMI